ncbi:MAG: hypothetical protein SVU32_00765 [Candidatus Nanohaloarchaea archaeon]|nr:hypothetical protein [Candidatus Nanohaloarchaea archaeon]
MPSREWERSVKIHEGCGGICRFVEAIDTPNVQWTGECLHCDATSLVLEDMIPIEKHPRDSDFTEWLAQVRDVSMERRRRAKWNNDDSWDQNQKRLREALELRAFGEPGPGGT